MAAPFVHTHRVRYHECDAQGIVFNANWFTFFDVTLTEWFRAAFGSYSALTQEHGVDVVLAETTARFRGSVGPSLRSPGSVRKATRALESGDHWSMP